MTERQQTLLTGPEVYLRPIVPADADTAPRWSRSLWPAPPEVVREQIEQQLGGDLGAEFQRQRFVILRHGDEIPIGAAELSYRGLKCRIRIETDPGRARDELAWVWCRTMPVVLSWLIDERSFMSVNAEFPGDHPEVDTTAASLGMRRCYRIRERTVWGNRRYDALGYQALHPAWVARLGEPPHGDDGPVDRDTPSPAPRSWSPRFDPPPSAVMVGDRLYLRAMTAEDAELAARAMLSETERFLPEGRLILNPRVTAQFVRDLARQQPPWWVRFAIVLGATGEPIGTNGLIDLDLLERSAETESEIWYAEHRSHGYGTEAKHLLLSYAFERLGLHTVSSWISEYNTRSIAAIRKQGYRDAGYFAWGDFRGTDLYGGYCFDLLASEWQAARR